MINEKGVIFQETLNQKTVPPNWALRNRLGDWCLCDPQKTQYLSAKHIFYLIIIYLFYYLPIN